MLLTRHVRAKTRPRIISDTAGDCTDRRPNRGASRSTHDSAANGTRGTFNIATGVETDVMTLWSVLKQAASSDIEPTLADLRPGELKRSCLDTARAQRELGWKATVEIGDGLRRTYAALVEEFKRSAV